MDTKKRENSKILEYLGGMDQMYESLIEGIQSKQKKNDKSVCKLKSNMKESPKNQDYSPVLNKEDRLESKNSFMSVGDFKVEVYKKESVVIPRLNTIN